MTGHRITIRGYRPVATDFGDHELKKVKIEKIKGYGLNASAKLKQRKSKRIRVKRKTP